MNFRNVNLERSDILGRQPVSPPAEVGPADLEKWRRRIGYLSLFAGAAAIVGSQAADVSAADKNVVPPRIAKQAAELVKKINSGSCSKPDLLKRQSEYRLPGQKASFNMLEVLAGADNCPGTPIPAGTYTSGTPFTDTGNNTGANSTVDFIQPGCSDYEQVAGPDHIYSFKITARGANPKITVSTTSPDHDLSIYILNGTTGDMCPVGPGADVTNCITGSDGTFAGLTEEITSGQMNILPLNTQLYLFIDSFYSSPDIGAGPYTVTIQDVTVASPFNPPANDAPVDMNGDGKSDFVVLRNTGGGASGQVTWFTSYQDGFPTNPTDWGIASDQFVPQDFDGDGKKDFAVWRPGTVGTWFIVRSGTMTLFSERFGVNGDDATVAGDYTGDGIADLAVYRSGATSADQSTWYYRSITAPPGVQAIPWGQGGDSPAPGDYDNDGKYDFVIQRPDPNGVNGRFWIREADGLQYTDWFGLKTDSVVPGDYDGDGKTDLAVARDDNGQIRWDYRPSGGGPDVSDTWGVTATDWIAQGDYDGDGKTEYTVWRPGTPGTFFTMTPVTRFITMRPWGATGDVPAANFNEH